MFSYLKTAGLLAVLTVILLSLGFFLGGISGFAMAVVLSLILNFGSYYFSDKIVLRIYGAKELDESEFSWIYDIVNKLSMKMELPEPKLYMVESNNPNAFATGRNPKHSAIAVTSGLQSFYQRRSLRVFWLMKWPTLKTEMC